MDHIGLRHEILTAIDEQWADQLGQESTDRVKSLVIRFTGKKLLVLYLMFSGEMNQKEIGEHVGISPAAVSKMINHSKEFSELRSYLLFNSEGTYDEKAAREGRGRSAAKARGYAARFPLMSPDELAIQWSFAKDVLYEQNEEDYTDGNVSGAGYDSPYSSDEKGTVKTLRQWARGSDDVGQTNEPLAEFENKYKSGDQIAEAALKARWAEQRAIEWAALKNQKKSSQEG